MAVSDYIDVHTLCKQALIDAGQPVPSPMMIEQMVNIQLQAVKSDIMFWAGDHPFFLTRVVQATVPGVRRVALPDDFHAMKQVLLLDGLRGVMQSPTALDAQLDVTDTFMLGKLLLLTQGAGAGQWRHLTGWDNVAKTPTVESPWNIAPEASTGYLVVTEQSRIFKSAKAADLDGRDAATSAAKPCRAAVHHEELWFNAPPDQAYGVWVEYYRDISRLDEDGEPFLKMLREWFSVFKQGLITKALVRFDDDRAIDHTIIYERLLRQLQSKALRVGQTVPFG